MKKENNSVWVNSVIWLLKMNIVIFWISSGIIPGQLINSFYSNIKNNFSQWALLEGSEFLVDQKAICALSRQQRCFRHFSS